MMQNSQYRNMTPDQQAALLEYTKIGLKWITGDISFDEANKILGNPEFHSDQLGRIEYAWLPQKVMSVSFYFERTTDESTPRISSFKISVENDVVTDIPYQRFDDLGLHRIKRGEKIDAARVEDGDFYTPSGVVDPVGSLPVNLTTFSYRASLPDNCPYDVYAGFDYLAELVSEKGPWNLHNVRSAVNLRELSIARRYLTPEELSERNKARRQFTN